MNINLPSNRSGDDSRGVFSILESFSELSDSVLHTNQLVNDFLSHPIVVQQNPRSFNSIAYYKSMQVRMKSIDTNISIITKSIVSLSNFTNSNSSLTNEYLAQLLDSTQEANERYMDLLDENQQLNEYVEDLSSQLDDIKNNQDKNSGSSGFGNLGSLFSGGLLGGLLGGITNAITSGFNLLISPFKQQEAALNDIMYQYGVGVDRAREMYNGLLEYQALPYQKRSAPEQRQFLRDQELAALNAGFNTAERIQGATEQLTKWNEIFENLNLESTNLLKTTIRYMDSSGSVVNEIMTQVRQTATDYMVTPELLMEVTDGYTKYLRAVTKSNTAFSKSMNDIVKTVGKLEDAQIDSQKVFGEISNFAMGSISTSSDSDTWIRLAMLGMNPVDARAKYYSGDVAGVTNDYVEGIRNYYNNLGYTSDNFNLDERFMTITSDILGFASSEDIQDVIDIIKGEYKPEDEKGVDDYIKQLSIDSAAYYDQASAGWAYITNKDKFINEMNSAIVNNETISGIYKIMTDEVVPKLINVLGNDILPWISDALDNGFGDKLVSFVERVPGIIDSVYNYMKSFMTAFNETDGNIFKKLNAGAQAAARGDSTYGLLVEYGLYDSLKAASLVGNLTMNSKEASNWKVQYDAAMEAAVAAGYEESKQGVADYLYDTLGYEFNDFGSYVDGSHATGLSYVPYDNYIAELHKGERVLTDAQNQEYMRSYDTLSDNISVNNELSTDNIKVLSNILGQFNPSSSNTLASNLVDNTKTISANETALTENNKLINEFLTLLKESINAANNLGVSGVSLGGSLGGLFGANTSTPMMTYGDYKKGGSSSNTTTGSTGSPLLSTLLGGSGATNAGSDLNGYYNGLTDATRQKIVNVAYQSVGLPYVWGTDLVTSGGKSADCSGFAWSTYVMADDNLKNVVGHNRGTTFSTYKSALHIPMDELLPGDWVWRSYGFSDVHGTEGYQHMGVYVGNGKVIHAKGKDYGIVLEDLSSGHWQAAGRPVKSGTYATGGRITQPTLALAGETPYDEYFISTDPKYSSYSKMLLSEVQSRIGMGNIDELQDIFRSDDIVDLLEELIKVVSAGFRGLSGNTTYQQTNDNSSVTSNLITSNI